ncbi:MAG TPA: fibronectin type III domain-containing protein [Solirubrobacteraceae bacterium]|nr:fibronectin type III domain-containing protein [Solirubrobacteraceae bacterium]
MGAARKPVLPVVAVCCVLVGLLTWSAVPALAVAPETPEVSVEALVPPTTAVVHGVLNPGVDGAPGTYELGTYEFLYKKGDTGCVGEGKAPVSPGVSLGAGKEAVTQTLSGLSPGTEYSLCLLLRDGIKGEQAVSAPVTFTTVPLLESPVTAEPASVVTATSATFEGELSPSGTEGRLSYQFDYNTNGTCKVPKISQGEEEEGKQQLPQLSTTATKVAEAKRLHVLGTAQELEPNETYTFCLVATNALREQAQGNEVSVLTGHRAPTITEASVTSITSRSATISAQIYPYGELATYRVEYGLSNTYGSSTPEASISAQHGTVSIQAQLTGLTPNSEYYYRIVATDGTGSEESPDATFTTDETVMAGSQGLPDDRAFEMVTPPDNEDADVYVPFAEGKISDSEGIQSFYSFQVATDGSAVAYIGDATSGGGNGEAGRGIGSQFLAKHLASSGWMTNSVQPAGVFDTKYLGFSSNLSVGVLSSGTFAEPKDSPLSGEAPGDGYSVLYARTTNESTYRPLFTKTILPSRSNVEFSEHEGGIQVGIKHGDPVFAGGSSGFNSLLFEANDALLGGGGVLETELENNVKGEIAKGENENYLYGSDWGHLSLIDVSPEGKVMPGATFGAPPVGNPNKNPPNFGGAISADGNRVYWSSIETLYGERKVAAERPTGLYLRADPGEPQSPVVNGRCSVPGDACTVPVSEGEAQYWASAADGRYAFYTEGEGLYRFNAEPEVNKVSREVVAGSGAGVLGVLGVSNDGESVYFVAKGVLAGASSEGANPVEGEPNLYLWHDGAAPIFIGTLSERDGSEVQPFTSNPSYEPPYLYGDWQAGLGHRTSRVTGSGSNVVFMSNQSLSVVGYPHGYPTAGNDEIYVYEAGSDSLFCASCGSTREGAQGYLPISWDDTYTPQWISEDGNRVFFDSESSLVPQATDGKQNVYEWEREGSGTCTTGSGVHGGCVFLLSGGTSESDSWLIGASETGNDVFLVTRAQLVPEDQNEAFDLYDVRVDGVKPVTPPQCTGSGCQGVPSPPPTFETPPSVTFNGVGNFAAPANPAVKAKAKSLSRAQKLTDALKQCLKKPKRKRASCETQARKHYGPIRKARKGLGTVVKGRK